MTAICGIWHPDGRPGAADACARMQRALAIYGSDRIGAWDGGEIALGIGLARLLPEDAYDRQPLTGGGGRFRLLADVRLDNRPELAERLCLPAAEARIMADADFVRAAWEKWQEGALDHLIGDFAIAVWDAERRRLHLARDFLGQRPLFYHHGRGFFAFASMAKGLHALPDMPKAPDLDTLRDYLALAPQRGPGSFFAHVNRVEPGSLVTLHADGRLERRDWYDWRLDGDLRLSSDAAYVEALHATFDRAVVDRLRATGPIASHLSGGLDSAAVTAAAAGMLAERGQGLTAYTHVPLDGVDLEEPRNRFGNEWPLAQTVARAYPNIEHVAADAPHRMMGGDLDAHFHYFEYPTLNLCNIIWAREIAQLAGRRRQKVLLTAGMGNMTISLSGLERPAELFRAGHFLTWFKESLALTRTGHSLAGAFIGRTFATFLPGRAVNRLRTLRRRQAWELSEFSALRREVIDSEAFKARMRALDYDPNFRPWPSMRAMARFVLRRGDLNGHEQKGHLAAFGIDPRDPTSDRRLVELVHAMPSSMFLRNGQTKWLYHQAFADRVPAEIRAERRKGYQGADWAERFRRAAPSLEAQMASAAAHPAVSGLMRTEEMLSAIKSGVPPGVPDHKVTSKYRLNILRGLSVGHFVSKMDNRNS